MNGDYSHACIVTPSNHYARKSRPSVPPTICDSCLNGMACRIFVRREVKPCSAAVDRLQGFPIPAAAWEQDILPTRIKGYLSTALDQLCSSGRIIWTRLYKQQFNEATSNKANLLRNTPIALIDRQDVSYWQALQETATTNNEHLSSNGKAILASLEQHGASFFVDIVAHTGLLRTHCEEALAELAAVGLVTSDSYSGLRALITQLTSDRASDDNTDADTELVLPAVSITPADGPLSPPPVMTTMYRRHKAG